MAAPVAARSSGIALDLFGGQFLTFAFLVGPRAQRGRMFRRPSDAGGNSEGVPCAGSSCRKLSSSSLQAASANYRVVSAESTKCANSIAVVFTFPVITQMEGPM